MNGVVVTGDKAPNRFFLDPSLAVINPMHLRGNGRIQKATGKSLHVMFL